MQTISQWHASRSKDKASTPPQALRYRFFQLKRRSISMPSARRASQHHRTASTSPIRVLVLTGTPMSKHARWRLSLESDWHVPHARSAGIACTCCLSVLTSATRHSGTVVSARLIGVEDAGCVLPDRWNEDGWSCPLRSLLESEYRRTTMTCSWLEGTAKTNLERHYAVVRQEAGNMSTY